MKFYIRANDSQFTSTDLAVFVHLTNFEETARRPIQVTNYRGRVPLGQEVNIVLFCRFSCRILPLKCWSRSSKKFYIIVLFCRFLCRILLLKCWPSSSKKFYIRAYDSQFTSTDLAVFVHLSHFETKARRPIQVTNYRGRVPLGQESIIFLFCRFFCRILQLKCWPRGSMKFYMRANESHFTLTDLAVFIHLSHFKTPARRPIQVTNYRG